MYDNLGQFLRENNEVLSKIYVYAYDKAGNRTSKKIYAYTDSNSLSSLTYTEETYTYGNAAWGDQLTKYNFFDSRRVQCSIALAAVNVKNYR